MAGTGFWPATKLVAEREIKTFVRLKGFWITIAVLLVGLFAAAVLPALIGGSNTSVAVVGAEARQLLTGTSSLDVRDVPDVATAERLVRSEEVDAAVVPGPRVIALDDPPTDVLAQLTTAPPVDLLAPAAVSKGVRILVIQLFAVIFLVFGMGGSAIAQSTVTEKQTRIVEILVATVPVRALLAGKILGHWLLTVGQLLVLAVAAPIALAVGGHSALLDMVAPALGWYVPFLCIGFVLVASLWAVAGALVSRQEDLGASMGPVMLLVMGPYFGVVFASDNASAMTVLSYVPFSSAVAMPVRLFTGEAQAWEALVSMGLLAATVVAIVLLASRLYAGSLLQTGGKVALKKAWARAD
ncbi:ABC transporter permease [Kibdelosporangium phytohabitans]|uniref:Sodium ABC transporter permease n=1 Tax=Kibdelosporangium phytohabitans TaxID=860235 RepID=A0A0N9HXV6_9PSEU|nr:ABC transporter permease [Kibdelosporangium phytohabitans]ALG10229.1 sodium ABC transporter permease [Kibdelosporangium phytohabitans]MBE1461255.1 ABC-2 type transport system permease protein [Kibdelosporangium phytohabitans]